MTISQSSGSLRFQSLTCVYVWEEGGCRAERIAIVEHQKERLGMSGGLLVAVR